MRRRLLLGVVALPLMLWALLPVISAAAPTATTARSLQKKIETTQGKIGRRKGTEKVLTSDITAYSRRIGSLQAKIGSLQDRQQRAQSDLDVKQGVLSGLQRDLRSERARLVRLRGRLVVARRQLSARLVEIYQADPPDLMTVVLSSQGFAELLERGEFLRRIKEQDRAILGIVRDARAEATGTERRLTRLESRQRAITEAVEQRRNEIRQIKQGLIDTRVGYDQTRSDKRTALTKVRGERHALEEDLEAMEKQQAKIRAALQGAGAGSGLPAAPIKRGSGDLIWPVNGSFTSPFGYRWGRLHAGIDIAAAEGTPIRAAMAGKVVLMQGVAASGGYGNYTCVQHTTSMSTCYAHQTRFGTAQGASVSQGQVIGYVGNTGHSFGAHLHFEVRINGSPTDPMGYL